MENDVIKLVPITIEMIDALLISDEAFYRTYNLINDAGEYLNPSPSYLPKIKERMITHPEEFPLAVDHLIILKENNIVIGTIYFKSLPIDGISEIGYGMNPKYEGHLYMTNAVKMMIDYGKKNGIDVVKADTLIINKKSQNVLLRNGFKIYQQDDKYLYFIKE